MALVELVEVVKDYQRGSALVRALDGVTFSIERGEFVAIMGPSGAGKSSLLHLLGGLDEPSSGTVVVDGAELGALSDEALTAFRRRRLGFVFQFFNLLPTLAAWENVALPRLLDGIPLARSRGRAEELLARVGLAHRSLHRPAEMSGGELQRVAVARALVAEPVLILADEPTGNLDSHTGAEVLGLLRSIVDDEGRTVVMVTHDAHAAAVGDRLIEMGDGKVLDGTTPTGSVKGAAPTGRSG